MKSVMDELIKKLATSRTIREVKNGNFSAIEG